VADERKYTFSSGQADRPSELESASCEKACGASPGKVAVVAVVGNDGAHHCHAAIFQALTDVGFTLPAGAGTYWVGQAMGTVDYKDLKAPCGKTVDATKMLVSNAVHVARWLNGNNYPGRSYGAA
jgi:hypothetical protein